MIEYPSIQNSSKAPRQNCIAFEKLDGSNFRAKWTRKRGFDTFGTRTQLIDETTPFWGEAVSLFKRENSNALNDLFRSHKDYRDEREFIVFGEFYGQSSFAGRHADAETKQIVVFDILCGHKNRKFIKPIEFIKVFGSNMNVPKVIYEGNLNDDFIRRVRANEFGLNEGVICKGTIPVGNAVGGIWMCKIKTQEYFDKLKQSYGDDWIKYGE